MIAATIHIVDDDARELNALAWFLSSLHHTVQKHSSARKFLKAFQDIKPAVLFFDVHMPDMGGIELLEIMKSEECKASIIMLTGYGQVSTAMQAVKLGAFDFLEKPVDLAVLTETLDNARVASEWRFQQAAHMEEREGVLSALTARERQIFDHLVVGQTNKMIAHELGIAERTVEVHRANVLRKTESSTLAALIKLAS